MVLDVNKQYHSANKFVVGFLTDLQIDQSVKEKILADWKLKGGPKLKSELQKHTHAAQPKRVVSKYLYFCNDERQKILNESPGMNIKAVTCELGKRWREFQANPDPERMTRYQALFDTDKKRYDEARATMGKDVSEKKKRPPSEYILFCNEQRKLRPKISMKELGTEWAKVKAEKCKL